MLKSFTAHKLNPVGLVTLQVTVINQVYHEDFQVVDIKHSVPTVMFLVLKNKKISNDQEPIRSDPTSCTQNQKGNN